MKKKFTFLIAAIAAILIMTLPEKVVGQNSYEITCNMSDQGWSNSTAISSGTLKTKVNGTVTNTVFTYTSGTGDSGTTEGPKYFTSGSNVRFYVLKASSGSTANGNWMQISIPSNTTVTAIEITGVSSYSPDIKYNIDGGSDVSCSASNNKYTVSSISATTSFKFRNVNTSTSTNTQLRITAIKITYTTSGGGSTVNTPEIIPNGGSFYSTQDVELSCTTEGASIYYTTDGTEPSSSSTLYSSAFTISSSCTVKAIATKSGMTNSSVAEATFTKITPYANIAALTAQTVTGTYYVTFDNVAVTYVNGNYAYLQDESGAVLYYKSGHGLTAGKVLNGTAQVSYKLQNNLPEIIDLSGVEASNGDAPAPTTIAQSAWSYTFTDVLSQYFKITDATLTLSNNKYYVSLNSENIQLYKQGGSISTLDLTKKYTIIGFPMMYNTTEEIQIFSDPGVEDLTIESSALALLYSANPSGSMAVTYSNFTPESATATLYSDSECNTLFPTSGADAWIVLGSMSNPYNSIGYNVSANEGSAARIVYMKVSAKNANNTTLNKVFTITQDYHHTYSVTYKANGGTGNDLEVTGYDYNTPVTVKANEGEGNPNFTKTGYTFQNWNTNAGGTGTTYIPNNNEHNTFNITANTNLFAQWQATTYDLHTAAMTNGSVSFKVNNADATTANTDQTVTLVVTPDQGYKLSTFTVTNDATSATVTVTNNTFTMPASSITVSATFEVYYAYVIDFESALSSYTNWTFLGMTSQGTHDDVDAYEGSYFGTTGGSNPAYLQTANKIASPQSLSCYVTKQTKNTTSSSWEVFVSSDGLDWGDAIATQDATSMAIGTWVELSADLSSYSNVYVKIKYSGSTATRNIDAVVLEYEPSEYAVTLSPVSSGTISASDGTTTITSGSANFETGKTITLTAEGDATHMFSSWSVTGATVADASSATTTFEMPANAVSVSATFVECWTFTYNINGNVVTEKYAKNGSSITLPTTSEYVPEGYGIIGWTETEGNVASPITSATASQNRTLYAVFGKITYSDFALVESAPSNWSGYYLIVYDNKKVFDTHYSNNLNTNTYATIADISTYYSNKVIAYNATTAQYIVKIEKTTNGYSIYDKDGYLGNSSNSNGSTLLWNDEFTAEQNEWTLGVNSIVGVKNNTKAIRYNTESPRFAIYATDGQAAIQLFKTTVSNEGAYTHIYPSNATATTNINVSESGPMLIESGSILNMDIHTLTCDDPTKLIIEDGGQLILHNSGVQATIKKNITLPSKTATNWYTIASPVRNVNIGAVGDAGSVNNLKAAGGEYDLYRFNETKNDVGTNLRWENYKNNAYHDDGADDFTSLETGRGYLYRREGTATLEYVGEVNGNASETYTLTVAGAAPLTGFHLIGNPYSHDIYKGTGAAIDDSKLNTGFYRLTNGTAWTAALGYGDPIHSGEGILVQANASGTLTISNSTTSASGESKYNNDNIMFSVSNSQHEDVTYAVFDKGHGLNKIEHRDASIPMLYINQDGEDYAIATMSDDTKMFSLNFKAMTMGKYTLSYKTRGEFNYLHVIDRLTGEDVDMLLEGEYSFVASPSDSDARFIVKLAYLPDYSDGEGDIFAYQNGSDIFVSGEGELQIFDVMGRFVMSERINGVKTISADELSKGVYVLRLVGNGMKTQKIVVK